MFITVAPSEDKVRVHAGQLGLYDTNTSKGDCTGPLCLHLDMIFKKLLLPVLGPHFRKIYEWSLRVEFQGRGTLHIHLAMWALLFADYDIAGRSGSEVVSKLVTILEDVFGGRVDIQLGNGFLNYINGYKDKAPT